MLIAQQLTAHNYAIHLSTYKQEALFITNDARCTREIKTTRIARVIAAFNNKILFSYKLNLNLRKALVKCYTCSTVLYSARPRTLRKVD
jgi:hypothetical protein